jgi:hypothetical protein
LGDQQHGAIVLHNLDHMPIYTDMDGGTSITSPIKHTPYLKTLDITMGHTPYDRPWAPNPTVFEAISSLKHRQTLNVRIKAYSVDDLNGDFIYTAITGADLLSLSRLPSLKSLCI